MPPGLTRAFAVNEQTGPKTVLGFCGVALGITAALTLGLVIALATTGYVGLAIAVLVGGFVLFAGIVGWVLITMQTDASRLVVGPMTGREFLEYQQWTAGDNLTGERLEARPASARPVIDFRQGALQLPPPSEEEEE